MRGIGTLLNTAAVILGGLAGLLFGRGISEKLQKSLLQACGVATIMLGIGGTLSQMLVLQDGKLTTTGTMLLIFSLVIGTAAGELLKIEDRMDSLGTKLRHTLKRDSDSRFVDGFVSVSLIICVGAMAIVGSIEDGIRGDWSMLAAKSVLDGILVLVFASTYGVGAVCSAGAIFVYQGLITLLAALFGEFLTQSMIDGMSFVGNTLIFCVGVNVAFGKKFRVGSMLPSLLIPVIYELILPLWQKIFS